MNCVQKRKRILCILNKQHVEFSLIKLPPLLTKEWVARDIRVGAANKGILVLVALSIGEWWGRRSNRATHKGLCVYRIQH